jgi:hypothetical protein
MTDDRHTNEQSLIIMEIAMKFRGSIGSGRDDKGPVNGGAATLFRNESRAHSPQ